jgi:hypothetical protein
MHRVRLSLAPLVAMLLLALLLWSVQPTQGVAAQGGVTNFDNVTISGDLLVGDDGAFGGNLSVAGAIVAAEFVTDDGDIVIPGAWTFADGITVTGNASVSGDLTVGDEATVNDLTVADFASITAQTPLTVTNGGDLVATGSLQPISASGVVTISGADVDHVADLLILVNTGVNTITITETTGLVSGGDIVLGEGDSATLAWIVDTWYLVAYRDN